MSVEVKSFERHQQLVHILTITDDGRPHRYAYLNR